MATPLMPLKWYKSLATRKGRLAAGAFIIEGERAIDQVIAADPGQVAEILCIQALSGKYSNYPVRQLEERQFRDISSAQTPQGIMAVVKSPPGIYTAVLPEETGNRVLLLEDIQDPGNTGTLIRTAAAFGYSGIIMTESCADPLSPKCVQSTAGSILSLWIRRTPSYLELVENLQSTGYTLAAAVLDGRDNASDLTMDRLVLALGNEAAGLSADIVTRANIRFRIPIRSEKAESLNVAACGAISMYLSVN